jgi:hypothetical protein
MRQIVGDPRAGLRILRSSHPRMWRILQPGVAAGSALPPGRGRFALEVTGRLTLVERS